MISFQRHTPSPAFNNISFNNLSELPSNLHITSVKRRRNSRTSKDPLENYDYKYTQRKLNEFSKNHPNGFDKLIEDVIQYYMDLEDTNEFLERKIFDDLGKLKKKKYKLKNLDEGILEMKNIETEKKKRIVEYSDIKVGDRASIDAGLMYVNLIGGKKEQEFSTIKQVMLYHC